jgi:aminoglycoside 6-adenylyltransferase
MNGSRVNPNALRDIFQDFDVVYVVRDVVSFKHNYEWIKRFSEITIMQLPEDIQAQDFRLAERHGTIGA